MSLRSTLSRLEQQNRLVRVAAPISKTYEIAGVLKKLEPAPVLFEHVHESDFRVAGNLFCSKAAFADYFGIPVAGHHPRCWRAPSTSARPARWSTDAPCQEVVVRPSPTWMRCPSCGTAQKTAATTSAPAW